MICATSDYNNLLLFVYSEYNINFTYLDRFHCFRLKSRTVCVCNWHCMRSTKISGTGNPIRLYKSGLC